MRREETIEALFDAHYPSLTSLAHAILGDAGVAEEVVSEAFLKAFTGWRRFQRVEYPPAYLRQMVVNGCRSHLRRRKIESRANARGVRSTGVTTEPAPGDLDLLAAVRRLPERQRLCIVLRYLEDLSEAEVAALLGCSIGTVKSQAAKARRTLKEMLAVDDGSELDV